MEKQGQKAVRGHRGQLDQQVPKGKRGSLASHAQPWLSFKVGKAMWCTCLARLERRGSPDLQGLACQESRAKPESVD